MKHSSSFTPNGPSANISEQANEVLMEAKKLGSTIYSEGKEKIESKMGALQEGLTEQSDKIVQQVHENPIYALLIAAGVGFLLAKLLKK